MSQWTLLALGTVTSLFGGALACSLFDQLVRRWLDAPKPEAPRRPVPSWFTGTVERIFFTILVAFDVAGYPVAMIVWLVAKMAATWTGRGTPRNETGEEGKRASAYRISSSITLLNGLVSMMFALIGGLIIQYALEPDDDNAQQEANTSFTIPAAPAIEPRRAMRPFDARSIPAHLILPAVLGQPPEILVLHRGIAHGKNATASLSA